MNYYLKTMALLFQHVILLQMQHCSTLSEIIWNSFRISGIILGSTLCKTDGHNWLIRMHNSFISDKKVKYFF